VFQKRAVRSCTLGRGSASVVQALQDEGDKLVRNVRSSLPSNSASHPKRPESSIIRLWKFQNPYTIFPFTWRNDGKSRRMFSWYIL